MRSTWSFWFGFCHVNGKMVRRLVLMFQSTIRSEEWKPNPQQIHPIKLMSVQLGECSSHYFPRFSCVCCYIHGFYFTYFSVHRRSISGKKNKKVKQKGKKLIKWLIWTIKIDRLKHGPSSSGCALNKKLQREHRHSKHLDVSRSQLILTEVFK